MKDKLLRNARNTNWSPSLSTVLHARIGINVIHQHLYILRLKFRNLLRISKDNNGIHGTHQHATSIFIFSRQVGFHALFDDLSSLIRHPQWLKRLQENRWTFLANFTHHIHGPLQPSDTSFEIEIRLLCQLSIYVSSHERNKLQMQKFYLPAYISRALRNLPFDTNLEVDRVLMLCDAWKWRIAFFMAVEEVLLLLLVVFINKLFAVFECGLIIGQTNVN